MKIALLTDLHANRQAVEAVWDHVRSLQHDRLVLLGDYVDYGADPVWVMDFVMARVTEGAIAVRGNHDEAVAAEIPGAMAGHVWAPLAWTRQQLSPRHKAFLHSLPLTASLQHCLMVHANAHAPAEWGYIHTRQDAARSLYATDAQIVFCGHVHQPQLYHLSATGKTGDFEPVDGVPIPLSRSRRWLAIPGSVGQPRDGNPAACYASLDTDERLLTFHRVPYDHAGAARRILDAGLPPALAQRLHDGL